MGEEEGGHIRVSRVVIEQGEILTWGSTDDAAPSVRAEIAFVANPHEGFWTDV
jgi:hypothetical protein